MFLMISSIVSSGICSQNLDEVRSNENIPSNQKYWSVPSCSFFLTPNFFQQKKGLFRWSPPFVFPWLWLRVNWTSTMKFIHLSTPKSHGETPFKSQHLPWLEFGALVADSKLQVRLPPKHFDKAEANRNNNLGGQKPVNFLGGCKKEIGNSPRLFFQRQHNLKWEEYGDPISGGCLRSCSREKIWLSYGSWFLSDEAMTAACCGICQY